MTDWKSRADELIDDYNRCCQARPRHGAVDVQLEKDAVGKWASHLATQRSWGTDIEIAEACHQLEPRLQQLKQKLIIEILTNGSI
jgi:hypothetical protein